MQAAQGSSNRPALSLQEAHRHWQLQVSRLVIQLGHRSAALLHHYTIMSYYYNPQPVLAVKICGLLRSLDPSTYEEIVPEVEHWVEYFITEQFTSTDDLAERLSSVTWDHGGSSKDSAMHPTVQRSFVDGFSIYVLRWSSIAAAEDLSGYWGDSSIARDR
jgi:hypothetical protein